MPTLVFQSTNEAYLVAEQLPEALLEDRQVFCQDKRALKVAIELVGIKEYQILGSYCRLRFPEEERECLEPDHPRIFVRCLSAYNNGYLHGLWIDATQEVEEIRDDINWMLSWSPVVHQETCEEWAIHGDDGFWSCNISENPDLEALSILAQLIEEYGEPLADFFEDNYYLENSLDWEEVVDNFNSCFIGHFDSRRHFVEYSEEILEGYGFYRMEDGEFSFWASHICWESVATDLFCHAYDSSPAIQKGYGIYVFRC